ncbi:MAG: response regulator transcription factor [Chloroflexota bacterium]
MPHIILVEDDRMIAEPIIRALKNQNYEVQHATSGKEGLNLILASEPDLVILDIMLPELDGWEVCKAVREESVVPIMMLTALTDEIDRILGLELGADDYITKPFSNRELVARIKALLRRVAYDKQTLNLQNELVLGDLVIEVDERRVSKNGHQLDLRYKEFELLVLLASHHGHVVSRAEIFDKIWGTDWLGDTRTLDVHIRWIREKLEDDPSTPRYIQTVRGVGYRFVEDSL